MADGDPALPRRSVDVRVVVNGRTQRLAAAARTTVADLLRDQLGLTGTHIGCEHGVCGACTVLLDGVSVRSCILYAGQVDGRELLTVEGLATDDGQLHPLQQAFRDEHTLQCGFCTPGMLLAALELVSTTPSPDDAEIREALSGNLCRCTGYDNIVRAVHRAAATMAGGG